MRAAGSTLDACWKGRWMQTPQTQICLLAAQSKSRICHAFCNDPHLRSSEQQFAGPLAQRHVRVIGKRRARNEWPSTNIL